MTGDAVRRARNVVTGMVLVAGATTGCAAGPVERVSADPWVEGGLPAYCSGHEGDDADFWALVHDSCRVAQDGDVAQAGALRRRLEELDVTGVKQFHETLVRLNRRLRRSSAVADEICAPGTGLGQDLGTDYRSWVIAHGQSAYDAVLADPEVLRDFPDATAGCGLGEPFGHAATDVYLRKTGSTAAESGLTALED